MQTLPKCERLCGKERIGELFAQGGRAVNGTVAARSMPNNSETSRLAAVAGKALGNAVLRNRMKRRIRAAYRLQKNNVPAGFDFVLMARKGLAEALWEDVKRDVKKAAERSARETCGRHRSGPNQ
jgi:ribonuclease P protein component, eubacterial